MVRELYLEYLKGDCHFSEGTCIRVQTGFGGWTVFISHAKIYLVVQKASYRSCIY